MKTTLDISIPLVTLERMVAVGMAGETRHFTAITSRKRVALAALLGDNAISFVGGFRLWE